MKARLLLAGGAALIACAQAIAAPSLTRQTQYGPVVGLDESASKGTHAWKGVPFAAAGSGSSPPPAKKCSAA